jgi:hypothetical protein
MLKHKKEFKQLTKMLEHRIVRVGWWRKRKGKNLCSLKFYRKFIKVSTQFTNTTNTMVRRINLVDELRGSLSQLKLSLYGSSHLKMERRCPQPKFDKLKTRDGAQSLMLVGTLELPRNLPGSHSEWGSSQFLWWGPSFDASDPSPTPVFICLIHCDCDHLPLR